ncbi:MAG TPA: CxxC-x17-CxxC domain-containing protein [Candidatus Sulfotelmatobacter sp.]|jgi:CxxC-x17-CxxC domain-containing protein|nr:CxxC-x17-CxxC domain-containing protein [Candidatus Sulfotelmatobacter sp.]
MSIEEVSLFSQGAIFDETCYNSVMAFDRSNRSGGGNRSFGKPRFNNSRPDFNNNRQEMFSATCANCGKQCEVPFRPNGNKPVLCRECFQNSNRDSDSRRPERRSFDRPDFRNNDNQSRANDYTAQFEMLNAKMDKILDLLKSPADTAPLESALTEDVLEEIAEEVQEEKETIEKKPKKRTVSKKTPVLM